MRYTTIILILFVALLALSAQSAEDEVIRLKQSMGSEMIQGDQDNSGESEAELARVKEDGIPGHWNMSVGTSFSYMKGYGSGMGFYAAPMYTLSLNDRWAVHGGLVASNYTALGNYMPGGELQSSNSFNSLAVFAAASYKMSERLILHGSGVKNLASYPLSPMAPGVMDNLSLGATYKLGDNISIGASVQLNQRQGYYHNPFGGSSFGSPYSSPFGW